MLHAILSLQQRISLFMPNHAIRRRACWRRGEPAAKMTKGSDLTTRAKRNEADVPRKLYQLPKETSQPQMSPELQDRNGVQWFSSGKVLCPDHTVIQEQVLAPVSQPGSPAAYWRSGQDACKGPYPQEVGFLSLTLITHHLFQSMFSLLSMFPFLF